MGPPRATARERVLAQWRGVDLSAKELARRETAHAAGAVLPRVLAKIRLDQRQSELEIVKAWQQLIDPAVAAHAEPSGLHRGTLFVTVDSNTWLSEIIRYRRVEILDRLQHAFGRELIRKIHFKLG